MPLAASMEKEISNNSSKTPIGEVATISCERCRRRKTKCDRRQPCSKCAKARMECVRVGSGEKMRPTPKTYVQALEGQVASLEQFIQKLASADDDKRRDMLAGFCSSSNLPPTQPNATATASDSLNDDLSRLGLARARAGQLRRLAAGNSAHFYGGTSLFQIHISEEVSVPLDDPDDAERSSLGNENSPETNLLSPRDIFFQYAPHDEVSQRLMSTFFKEQYQYNMCVYREYFLRDYDIGAGRYYSDMLLYAICAMGALATGDDSTLPLSDVFSLQAQSLLYTALDNPDLTTLQALILLGQREIGHGRASKGWLFCGMAFRLAHEMGLHLDPNNWNTSQPDIDHEILRRVYWAAFITDKQLSLYFGRPAALYLHESDVRDAVRIPYPTDWEGLLNTYVGPGYASQTYEEGTALVGAFIYQAELSKIIHIMIADLFENRRANADSSAVAATVQRIHVLMVKWLTSLPGKLYWNQWTVGQVPSCVLHLHMLFHTAMIILHRPPRQLFSNPGISHCEDVEICYESLQAIFRLMRSYSRYYRYDRLPLDFIHTLSTAAGTILMKRYFEGATWDDAKTSRSLSLILEAMDAVYDRWPCIREIKESIVRACRSERPTVPETELTMDLDFITFLGLQELTQDTTAAAKSDIPAENPPEEITAPGGDSMIIQDIDDILGGKLPWYELKDS